MKTVVVFLCLVYSFETHGLRRKRMSEHDRFSEMISQHSDNTEETNELNQENAIDKLQTELAEIKHEFRKYQKDQDSRTDDVINELSTIQKIMKKLKEKTTSHDNQLDMLWTQMVPKNHIKLSHEPKKKSEELKHQKPETEDVEHSVKSSKGEEEDACQNVVSLGYKYDRITDFCYKVHHTLKTWQAAYEVCRTEGGYLAKVNTVPKFVFVTDIIRKDLDNVDFYLGATDKEEDGVWRWVVDNSTFPEFHLKGHKSCLEIDRQKLQLDDSGCRGSKQKFFCEVRQRT